MSLLDVFLFDPYRVNVWIAHRADGIAGSGTLNDPYDGSSSTKFDTLMNSFAEFTRVNLGPGTFETRGYSDDASGVGWQPKRGMKIVGSGIDITTLKLVSAAADNKQYFAVGHALATSSGGSQGVLADFFEISDLTIDCNLDGQTSSLTACGAIRIKGSHSRIRRVKATKWGTKTTLKACYVIATITADPAATIPGIFDTVIDECFLVEPSNASVSSGVVVVLHAGHPGKDGATDLAAFPEPMGDSAVIRNCFVDGGQANLATDTRDVRALSVSWCHGAIVESNQIYNVRNGGPHQSQGSVQELIVRNNFYKNVVKGPFFDLGKLSSSSLSFSSFTLMGSTGTGTTAVSHFLRAGDRIKLTGSGGSPTAFAAVSEIVSSTQFKFTTTTNWTGGSFKKVFGVDKALIEGNTIELALLTGSDVPVGIHVNDTPGDITGPPYPNGQIISRDNRIRYVDGLIQSNYVGYALEIRGTGALIARNNVIEVYPDNPIKNRRCGSVSYFNNTDPGGDLIQGYDPDTGKKYDELETEAEDALVLALLKKG